MLSVLALVVVRGLIQSEEVTGALWWTVMLTAGVLLAVAMLADDRWSARRSTFIASLREFWQDYRELTERRALIRRPWVEEFVHWSFDGRTWQLHGHLPPPPGGRSTTRSGWCPALRAAARRPPQGH